MQKYKKWFALKDWSYFVKFFFQWAQNLCFKTDIILSGEARDNRKKRPETWEERPDTGVIKGRLEEMKGMGDNYFGRL
jgi:hypothetical protein